MSRPNPKRLAELAEALRDLREWCRIELKLLRAEDPARRGWVDVKRWAEGVALKKKINLEEQFQHGAVAPETADTVKPSVRQKVMRRDGGEIPIPQDSRERKRRPMLFIPRREARP